MRAALPFHLSRRALQTQEQPISYFMQQAIENPGLISLAAGLVDPESLPAAEVQDAMDAILSNPAAARAALQYGTTQGYAPLRDKALNNCLRLDGQRRQDSRATPDDVVLTTGSQQLLYVLGELLFDPGDIVITEAPSYFVYHGVLSSLGARTLQVPMDEEGMVTDALEDLLARLERTGELQRVRLIYCIDYFQNPTGLTMSLARRRHLLDIVRRYSRKQRILILEDAAYRELRFDGTDLPSIHSLDEDKQFVILGMTFSKPMAPGLKTGYGILPRDLVGPFLRFKGNHDFGSGNLTQHVLDRILASGAYDRHVALLRQVYLGKRDALLAALEEEFGASGANRFHWTTPAGGFYVWLTCPPDLETGPQGRLMSTALRHGVLYVPGQFCYVDDGHRPVPRNEARLCYGVASPEELREAVRRLGAAAAEVGHPTEALVG